MSGGLTSTYQWKAVTHVDDRPDDWRDVVVEVATLADFEAELSGHGIDPATLSADDLDELRDLFVAACQFTEAVTTAVGVFAEMNEDAQH